VTSLSPITLKLDDRLLYPAPCLRLTVFSFLRVAQPFDRYGRCFSSLRTLVLSHKDLATYKLWMLPL